MRRQPLTIPLNDVALSGAATAARVERHHMRDRAQLADNGPVAHPVLRLQKVAQLGLAPDVHGDLAPLTVAALEREVSAFQHERSSATERDD